MTARLLDGKEEREFEEMARSLLDAGTRPTFARIKLGKHFGLTAKQVQNALGRINICLSRYRVKCRSLRSLTKDELDSMVKMAFDLNAKGMPNDEIRATVAAEYNVYERSVATRCLKAGLDIRSDLSVIKEPMIKEEEPEPEPDQIDFNIKGNIFAQAACKVDGASYVPGKGCYIGRTPVSGNYLMREAGMEFPQ